MDVTGLVFSAVSMVTVWNSCVQAFDTIASGRRSGMDYEIIRVKLEVERIRLLTWGETVNLSKVPRGHPEPYLVIDSRLNREEIKDTVFATFRLHRTRVQHC